MKLGKKESEEFIKCGRIGYYGILANFSLDVYDYDSDYVYVAYSDESVIRKCKIRTEEDNNGYDYIKFRVGNVWFDGREIIRTNI